LAIAASPAARIAHFKIIAMRIFGSCHSIAANRKPPRNMIAEMKRRADMGAVGDQANGRLQSISLPV
jgi:hypothetical protein